MRVTGNTSEVGRLTLHVPARMLRGIRVLGTGGMSRGQWQWYRLNYYLTYRHLDLERGGFTVQELSRR